jgi:ubiquinone/menaquinone biosynthesis C-methylase UbiE
MAWYENAFADDYLWIYAHRSESEAEKEVRSAIDKLPYEPGQHLLDLACGAGRHMLAFGKQGARLTGVDLSPTLLHKARERLDQAGQPALLIRADMRCLPFNECFDCVTMWFTSFGYFSRSDDDLSVLESLLSVLKQGGWWWIDIPNPANVIRTLVPESEREADGPNGRALIIEKRRISGDRVIKNIIVEDSLGKREYTEKVRLYSPERFGNMVSKVGLRADGVLGNYDGSPLHSDNPRQIWYGVKP